MNTYQPGTVAVATVRGVPNVRVMWREESDGWREGWWAATGVGWNDPISVTDIRPLVVLDLGDYDRASAVAILAHAADMTKAPSDGLMVQIVEAIKEQTKPPRIPEPGLWGVVEAGSLANPTRRVWVRYGMGWRDLTGNPRQWRDLIDPTLVRPGVEDPS